MPRSSVPAGFCDICGNQLFVGQKFCSRCGTTIDPNAHLQFSRTPYIAPQPVNTVAPPLKVENPSYEQVLLAASSSTNPYAPWGELIIDGTTKRVFPENIDIDNGAKYIGNTFRQYADTNLRDEKSKTVIDKGSDRSFAYQALIKCASRYFFEGGLLFLADAEAEGFFAFTIDNRYYHFRGEEVYILNKGDCAAIRPDQSNLLAVVVQEPGIIDLYINLVHVERVLEGMLLDNTFLGVGARAEHNDDFYLDISKPKVWVKKNT